MELRKASGTVREFIVLPNNALRYPKKKVNDQAFPCGEVPSHLRLESDSPNCRKRVLFMKAVAIWLQIAQKVCLFYPILFVFYFSLKWWDIDPQQDSLVSIPIYRVLVLFCRGNMLPLFD